MSDNGDILAWLQGHNLALQGFESPDFWEPLVERPYTMAVTIAELQYLEDFRTYVGLAPKPSTSPQGSASSEQTSMLSSWTENSDGLVKTGRKGHDQKCRRREQNRRAQQAYRARKEKLQEHLEAQICEWRAKYDSLLRSHADQSNEIRKLQSMIRQLREQPDLLQLQVVHLLPR